MVRVYCMYGLGGRLWSAGMDDVVAASLRVLKGVFVDRTRDWSAWREIVADIKNNPGHKYVVIGHSMGAAAATYVTDHVHVDLVVCYDCAGLQPSPIAKNCEKLLDFRDVGFDITPNFRPYALKGYEDRIVRLSTQDGHIWQDDDPNLAVRVVKEVKALIA